MTTASETTLRLGMNLKNMMKGPGDHLPAIFAMDTRLRARELILISVLLSYLDDSNGLCMPTDSQLAEDLNYSTETVRSIRHRLWELGYLTWEESFNDRRKNLYEFLIPYQDEGWLKSLKWQTPRFKFTKRSFKRYLEKILQGVESDIDEITQKIWVVGNIHSKDKIIGKDKIIKELENNPKNLGGSSCREKPRQKIPAEGEACLRDPTNEYYEDNPDKTRLLLNVYSTWRQRRSGGNGEGVPPLQPTSKYYKYFVKLRKKLLDFRGPRTSPNDFTLFWDFFRLVSNEFDKMGWTSPYIRQWSSDFVWEVYINRITDGFPNGSYWWETEFSVDELTGEKHEAIALPKQG
jgi:hypothetical protein